MNGVLAGPRTAIAPYSYASYPAVPFVPGNITAVAYDDTGAVLAVHTVVSAGSPTRLHAWVETAYAGGRDGSVVAADGQDAALVGVSLLDAAGVLVPNSDVNVTFTVTGPARILGTANGDPADHTPPTAVGSPVPGTAWRFTFHGLARLILASSAPGAQGAVLVTATAPGMQPAAVQLTAR